jgi:hypothetical protein
LEKNLKNFSGSAKTAPQRAGYILFFLINKRQKTLLFTLSLLSLHQVSGNAPGSAHGNIFKNV